jgi:pentatricopeptide repeat protein
LQANARYPDFKHKKTQKALWLNSKFNPLWVQAELAVITPGTLQSSIFSWNARLAKHAKAGQYDEMMELFQQLQQEGIVPDKFTFARMLHACAGLRALEKGRHIHTQIIVSGCETDNYVGDSLVDMYAKCGSMEEAWRVFNSMLKHGMIAWNAMILGLVKCRQGQEALALSQRMQQEGVEPDPVTFIGILNACASLRALEEGKCIHEQIIKSSFDSNVNVTTRIINMYVKCGSMEDAFKVFHNMPTRDVAVWNVMILGYVKCGQGQKALALYEEMQHEGVKPNSVTFVGAINACASIIALEQARHIHKQIIDCGYESNLFVGSSLVDMYAKCGRIEDACSVFNRMPTRGVVAWNAMIFGKVKCGQGQKALALFQQMQQEGVQPDFITFLGVLSACARIEVLEEGRRVHQQIIESGFESNAFVGSSLVDMYAKCGSIEDAWRVFDKMLTRDVISWNAIILGYVKCGQGHKALALFQQMQQEGIEPDSVTLVGVLKACASLEALREGRCAHEEITRRRLNLDVFLGSSLVDMYAKCGSIEDASKVFNEMPSHNMVAWSAMISGHVKCGEGQKGLELFHQMQQEGVEPDTVTFLAVLNACAIVMALEEGRRVEKEIHKRGYGSDEFVVSGLVDMYAKCGSI